jgi:hypothetical protein
MIYFEHFCRFSGLDEHKFGRERQLEAVISTSTEVVVILQINKTLSLYSGDIEESLFGLVVDI